MACTTLLVGRDASYDGSTMVARNEDSGAGHFTPKRLAVVLPEDQPRQYVSVLSHVKIDLPENPLRYTAMPNATGEEGIWGAAGVNAENIAMTATETITSNERVLAGDPLVRFVPARGDRPEQPGGIGEEDFLTIVLPYIHSAREGVLRLGRLLEEYGTYEMNGIAFQDIHEIWWMETIGGHHWIAKRVPDDAYVVMPNQLGIDAFDIGDALGEKREHLCSEDLREFISENHLDLSFDGDLNPRDAFGSHADSDHIYNTPRAWFIERYLNPNEYVWEGPEADFKPDSDNIPWCLIPEKKITVEDVKYVLSSHFQGTPYDCYGKYGDAGCRGQFRPIGINRNNFLSLTQLRPYRSKAFRAIEWVAFGSNVFNAFVPLYANVNRVPEYFANTGAQVTTENFYWSNRIIGALADSQFAMCQSHVERYQSKVAAEGHRVIYETDRRLGTKVPENFTSILEEANERTARMVKENTALLLDKVLFEATSLMKNGFSRSDA